MDEQTGALEQPTSDEPHIWEEHDPNIFPWILVFTCVKCDTCVGVISKDKLPEKNCFPKDTNT